MDPGEDPPEFRPNAPVPAAPPEYATTLTGEDVAAISAIREMSPDVHDAARAFGRDIELKPDGTPFIRISGKKEMGAWGEMNRRSWTAALDRHKERAASAGAVTLHDPSGELAPMRVTRRRARVTANLLGLVERRARIGGVPCERGPDGMFFRWTGKFWEPTGKAVLSLAADPIPIRGLQHAPDGTPWRGLRDRWVCMGVVEGQSSAG